MIATREFGVSQWRHHLSTALTVLLLSAIPVLARLTGPRPRPPSSRLCSEAHLDVQDSRREHGELNA